MIVHDAGDAWQIVLQPHHADLSGALARSWGNARFATPTPLEPMVIAATRHDDGWAVWERTPRIDGDGKPMPFLAVSPPTHLAFFRAQITDVIDQNPYAGLLTSMHGSGVYRGRYGTVPAPASALNRMAAFKGEVDAFVDEQEARQAAIASQLGVSEQERWTNYRLLQVYDRLSLYFSGFFPLRNGELHTVEPVPVDYAGNETAITVAPLAGFEPFTPTHVRMDPFPFAEAPARFTILRRVLPKRTWTQAEFVEAFEAAPLEETELLVEAP